ncbi:MAG: hypothetical protein ACREUR_04700 [Nitrosospira sp.]
MLYDFRQDEWNEAQPIIRLVSHLPEAIRQAARLRCLDAPAAAG